VILEISISKEEGFLSPKASNKINTHPSGGSGWSGGLLRSKESEVLRCSNKETTVKAYINMNDLANMIVDTINLHGDKEETYLEMGTGILKIYFGSSLAKKLMSSSHPFRKSFLSALPK
jgi:hypothetical protein